jgi:endo-1,4-beta-xylanase
MNRIFNPTGLLVALLMVATACQNSNPEADTLKDAFSESFYIGTALNTRQYTGQDERAKPIVEQHFNSITAENDMKWMYIHPAPDTFNFEMADQFVEFGEQNDMFIIGHTLVWHSQTPRWVFEHEDGTPLTREELLARMEDHITTIVTRYKGRVHGWDVVNEAVNDDGSWRESPWYRIIGEDFVAKAFEFAHAADPDAELYYNDFNLHQPQKADAAVELVKAIQAQGIPVTGIGMQAHYGLDYPTAEDFEASIKKFKELGIVAITELDIDVLPAPWSYMGADVNMTTELREELNPYKEGLPDSLYTQLASQYKMLFEVMLKHSDAVNRVTTWGVTDGDSWKNNWPMPGRTNYTLLFDREGQAKPFVNDLIQMGKSK